MGFCGGFVASCAAVALFGTFTNRVNSSPTSDSLVHASPSPASTSPNAASVLSSISGQWRFAKSQTCEAQGAVNVNAYMFYFEDGTAVNTAGDWGSTLLNIRFSIQKIYSANVFAIARESTAVRAPEAGPTRTMLIMQLSGDTLRSLGGFEVLPSTEAEAIQKLNQKPLLPGQVPADWRTIEQFRCPGTVADAQKRLTALNEKAVGMQPAYITELSNPRKVNILTTPYALPECVPVESEDFPQDGACFARRPKINSSYPVLPYQYKSYDSNLTYFGLKVENATQGGAAREITVECHYESEPEKSQNYHVVFGKPDAPVLYQYAVSRFETESRIIGSKDARGGIPLTDTPWSIDDIGSNGGQQQLNCKTLLVVIPSQAELRAINEYMHELSNQNRAIKERESLAKGPPLERLVVAAKAMQAHGNPQCGPMGRDLIQEWYPIVKTQIENFGIEQGRKTVDKQIELLKAGGLCLPRDYAL
jgi:hypothetical protein